MNHINHNQLFRLCCIALTVTAMTFAIRAGILTQLSLEHQLSNVQLGWINSMAFLGFPVATLLGGLIYNKVGPRKLIALAFSFHVLGLAMTIGASGFWTLLISTFLIGFANGAVEAGCNPLITEMYQNRKSIMLNRFHVWFPGGIVIGALISNAMTSSGISWHWQIAIMLLPTLAYGYLLLNSAFPERSDTSPSTLSNLSSLKSPLFLFAVLCMTLTATSELGTQQWISLILGASGASPMLIMALITGIMALGRYFSAPVIGRFNSHGVLLYSSILTAMGIYLMSITTGPMIYTCAIIFALGVTYFWPTMLGLVAEHNPQSGALGLSILGGAGMLAVSLYNPVIGQWIDRAKTQAMAQSSVNSDVLTGQLVLTKMLVFPVLLILLFTALNLYLNRRHTTENHHEAN